MTRNPKLAEAIENQHAGSKVHPLLAKPDGSAEFVPTPRTEMPKSSPDTSAIDLAAVQECDWIAAWLTTRPVPEPVIDPDDPLGLNEPEPEERPGHPECNCGAGDCCPERDDPAKALQGVEFRRLEDVQSDATVRAAAAMIVRLESPPKQAVLTLDDPPSLAVPQRDGWRKAARFAWPFYRVPAWMR